MHKLAMLIVMLTLAACGDTTRQSEAEAIAAPESAASKPAAPATPAPAPATPAPTDDASGTAPKASLAVEGEGLRAFNRLTGAARPLAFGSTRADTVAMLEAVLGKTAGEQGDNIDCGAVVSRWDNGLDVWFSNDRFVGWSLRESGATVTTASGIGLGSTRSELESTYSAKIAPSSLGTEFTAGGLAGLLDSPKPDARITHLWAGATCIAR